MIVSQLLTRSQPAELVAFYKEVFGDVEVLASQDFGEHKDNQFRHVRIFNHTFYMMSGGETADKVPALFYMIVFPENEKEELKVLHQKLRADSRELSDIEDMRFTKDLYMFQDKFGVAWQFWTDEHCDAPSILPCMVMSDELVGKLDVIKEFYTAVFSEIEFGIPAYLENGLLDHVSVRLGNHELQVCETSKRDLFSFDTISSLNIQCNTQEQIDYYSDALGDVFYMGGWLKDKIGINWCVDWADMLELLKESNLLQEEAMFKSIMNDEPINIKAVQQAFDNHKN